MTLRLALEIEGAGHQRLQSLGATMSSAALDEARARLLQERSDLYHAAMTAGGADAHKALLWACGQLAYAKVGVSPGYLRLAPDEPVGEPRERPAAL